MPKGYHVWIYRDKREFRCSVRRSSAMEEPLRHQQLYLLVRERMLAGSYCSALVQAELLSAKLSTEADSRLIEATVTRIKHERCQAIKIMPWPPSNRDYYMSAQQALELAESTHRIITTFGNAKLPVAFDKAYKQLERTYEWTPFQRSTLDFAIKCMFLIIWDIPMKSKPTTPVNAS